MRKRIKISNEKNEGKIIPIVYQRTLDGGAQFVFNIIINDQSLYVFINKNYDEMCEILSRPNTYIIKGND